MSHSFFIRKTHTDYIFCNDFSKNAAKKSKNEETLIAQISALDFTLLNNLICSTRKESPHASQMTFVEF